MGRNSREPETKVRFQGFNGLEKRFVGSPKSLNTLFKMVEPNVGGPDKANGRGADLG
jgi:hypothetical protein